MDENTRGDNDYPTWQEPYERPDSNQPPPNSHPSRNPYRSGGPRGLPPRSEYPGRRLADDRSGRRGQNDYQGQPSWDGEQRGSFENQESVWTPAWQRNTRPGYLARRTDRQGRPQPSTAGQQATTPITGWACLPQWKCPWAGAPAAWGRPATCGP